MANINITNLPDGEIEIVGKYQPPILWPIGRQLLKIWVKKYLSGFRPGHAPEKIVVERIGEDRILFEMADRTLGQAYINILVEHKIDAVGEPEITLTKIAKDNPLGFKIKTAMMPEVKLPDYKNIASTVGAQNPDENTVTDEELNRAINDIRRSRIAPTADQTTKENSEPVLPELTDEFVKTLGDFADVADFTAKVKVNMATEKKNRSRDNRRLAIIEKIGQQANIQIPKALVEHELEKMLAEMKGQIESMGLKFDDYLIHIKKTEGEMKIAWQDDAKKRVRFGLVVRKLAKTENIKPSDEDIKNEIVHLMAHDPELSAKASQARLEICHQCFDQRSSDEVY